MSDRSIALHKKARLENHDSGLAGWAFLLPFLLFNIVFLIYPFFRGAWISLHHWDLLGVPSGKAPTWTGFSNYSRLLADPIFWISLGHTLEFCALSVPLITVIALLLALALNRPFKRHAVLRGIFFSSGVFSVTVVTLIWLAILNPSRGLLGLAFQGAHMKPVDLLASRVFAMPALVLTTLWWSVGLPMSIFLAGLQQIPRELYEAAELDHSSRFRTLRKITLPSLRRTTGLVIVLQMVLQLQIFGQVLLMTRGGPANATRVLVQQIYETGFRDWEVGYASAQSVFLFALMLGVSLLQLKLTQGSESGRANTGRANTGRATQ